MVIIIPSINVSLTDNLSFLFTAKIIRAEVLDFARMDVNQNFLYVKLKWSF